MLCFFLRLEFGVFLLELLDAAGGIDQFLLAGEIGMAMGADFDRKILRVGGISPNLVPARAGDDHIMQLRMNFLFHNGTDPYTFLGFLSR